MQRRTFLKIATSTIAATVTGLSSWLLYTEDSKNIEFIEKDIYIKNAPANFDGYKIGFLTDIHFGKCIDADLVQQAVVFLNAQKIDLLLLGGDLIWSFEGLVTQLALSLKEQKICFGTNFEEAAEIYENLANHLSKVSAPDGSFAVYGNHDRWIAPIECKEELSKKNIRLLINESVTVARGNEKITLLGYDDYWTGIPEPIRLPPQNSATELRVALSHNPDFFSMLLANNNAFFDLGLSGHTHGGQIKIPYLGAPFYNVRDRRLGEGLWQEKNCQIYTSRGIGSVWIPLRLFCRPEATVITIRNA